jgi:glycosyltransferase involved in cell wall biosynthesis
MNNKYLIVTGDLTPWGGMDRPNFELGWHLAERMGAEVHLVSHRVAHPLSAHRNVTWHRVPRPLGSHVLGSPLLCRRGREVAGEVARAGGTVVVNGGNCLWGDVNWVHYVHNVPPIGRAGGPFLRRQWDRWNRRRDRRRERRAVAEARLIITNSDLAKDRLIAGLPVDPARVRTIYYGVDPEAFHPPSAAERVDARRVLGLPTDRPLVAFVGALGHDRRKGFDVLFDAWCRCVADGDWDAVLVAAGAGSELDDWRRRAAESGLEDGIRMLGFTESVPSLLAAADALVSPTRFEPYGQGVHEAICCGLPAFVTRGAGISERYPADLQYLLLDDPPDAAQLSGRLKEWRGDIDGFRRRMALFSERLRRRAWSDMATEFIAAIAEGGR